MAGPHARLPSLLPVLSELWAEPQFSEALKARATAAVTAASRVHPDLSFAVDENLMQGDDAYALSLVLAGESVNSRAIESDVEATFELQALVLVGNVSKDPMKQRIVTSLPLRLRHRTILKNGARPSREQARQVFRSMLLGTRDDGAGDLVAEWQARLPRISLRERDVWIAVSPLKFSPEALAQSGLDPARAADISHRATSLIEANLSRTADIPIVPSSYDGALEELTLNFADRGVVAFRNPDPSHVVDLSVFGLRSFAGEQAMSRQKKFVLAFGGGFLLDFARIDPDRNKSNEFSMRLKSVQMIDYSGDSKDARRIEDSDGYSALIMSFAEQLSTSLSPANARWLEQARADSETRSVRELVQLARKIPSGRR